MLRPYQQAAFDAAISHIKTCLDPCVIEAATGAGKSHIIAALAQWVNKKSGKKVLCLAPSKELITQNHEKYLHTGNPASIYCASINKSMAHDVIFGSPVTVLNAIEKFTANISAVVIDECHGITPTIKKIIEQIQVKNKKLRVVGLTATPYRLGSGYIYQYDENNKPISEFETKNPYFNRLVYRITAHELIEMGFLTAPHAEVMSGYDAQSLTVNKMGNFDNIEVERVFEGQGRKTYKIVQDFVSHCQGRKGVMVFAATIQHANEIMQSLDPDNARIVTGSTKPKERENIIADFKRKRFKYLVNVSVLTTGFDASHVDSVVIMRATESVGLLQQIVGRGLRLDDNKNDCLILDYAKNIERHCPDGDIFNPRIKAYQATTDGIEIDITCPDCKTSNTFKARENPEEFAINQDGYFVDLMGSLILNDDDIPIPAHYGRRCFGQILANGINERCNYRWSSKDCDDCGQHNDIAARYCEKCKGELIDPNEKLVIEFTRMKKDTSVATSDKVLSWRVQEWQSQSGNQTVKIDYVTEYASFPIWYSPKQKAKWLDLCQACGCDVSSVDRFIELSDQFALSMPKTIKVKREKGERFFKVIAHNLPEDRINEVSKVA